MTRLIQDGHEIAFGTAIVQTGEKAFEDYRECRSLLPLRFVLTVWAGYVFRLIAAGPATEGLYAHYDVSHELGRGSFATVMKVTLLAPQQ